MTGFISFITSQQLNENPSQLIIVTNLYEYPNYYDTESEEPIA